MTATRIGPRGGGTFSRSKGAAFERRTARALTPWYPDVRRSRDNGSADTTDTGDLAFTNPALWWSLKNRADLVNEPDRLIGEYMREAREKAGPGRIGLLVGKRELRADVLSSWCWLWLNDLAQLLGTVVIDADNDIAVRLSLRDVLALLAAAGLAREVTP